MLLGHVDTVLADPSEWAHDPWSGDVADGFLWGRGALDMKSQVAAEAVAGADARPRRLAARARRTLKLVFVSDEETGGDVGAHWLTDRPPRQGPLRPAAQRGRRAARSSTAGGATTASAAARRGSSASTLTARGAAGHASLPRTGDNALLKLAPVLERLARPPAGVRR